MNEDEVAKVSLSRADENSHAEELDRFYALQRALKALHDKQRLKDPRTYELLEKLQNGELWSDDHQARD